MAATVVVSEWRGPDDAVEWRCRRRGTGGGGGGAGVRAGRDARTHARTPFGGDPSRNVFVTVTTVTSTSSIRMYGFLGNRVPEIQCR